MNILALIETLGPGGAERFLVNLLPALREHGVHCEVAALWPPYDLASELEQQSIRVHRLGLRHRWAIHEAIRRVGSLVRSSAFDIIHSQLFFADLYSALTIPLKPRVFRVATFQMSGDSPEQARGVKHWLKQELWGLVARHCFDGISACGQSVARWCASDLGVEATVIYNAVTARVRNAGSAELRRQTKTCYGIGEQDFLLTSLGRLVAQKGHLFLLEALVHLKGRSLFPKLIIAGNGPLRESLDVVVHDWHLDGQVRILPAMPHREAMLLLHAADAVIMPSTMEGMGIAAAEAMCLGRAIIASRTGGLDELIEDGVSGRLVPVGDSQALAEAIEALMRDHKLSQQFGAAAKQAFEDRFSLEKATAQWLRYYREVIKA
jgi:glycosyltransferase involved in cell wall biosynthesis